MFKKLLLGVAAVLVLIPSATKAQSSEHDFFADSIRASQIPKCGLTKEYIMSRGTADSPTISGATASITPIDSFPPHAKVICGRFTIYYEDIALGVPRGFNEGFVGIQRQNNLCAVIEYIESVFSFGVIPTGAINLYVGESDYIGGPASTIGFARGMPFYSSRPTLPPCERRNGYVHQYITTGLDPHVTTPDYHAELKVNFQLNYQNNHTITTPTCDYDLYTVLLHEMSHVLGWFSFMSIDPSGAITHKSGSTTGPFLFTNLDHSMHYTSRCSYWAGVPTSAPFASIAPVVSSCAIASPTFIPHVWTNSNQPPYNHAIGNSDLDHLYGEYYSYEYYARVSPGDFQSYVLANKAVEGVLRRTYTKGELETFTNSIGYTYTSAYATTHNAVLTNHTPYSKKMMSDVYGNLVDFDASEPELIPVDYTVVNDVGNSVVIDLNALTDLVDDDADHLYVMDGSLHNIRGCGIGGNNHNCLTLNTAEDKITFVPRDDFYGKAQFGFNLWDGKEKGGYVIFTINVTRGNKVDIPYGDNLVLNGDFEEGSEVKILGVAENVNNSRNLEGISLAGRWFHGQYLSDCHPFGAIQNEDQGISIKNSSASCSTSTLFQGFGSDFVTFPYLSSTYSHPLPVSGIGNRYQPISSDGQLFYLGEELQDCHRYVLEFDAIRSTLTGISYPALDDVEFGFTNDANVVKPSTGSLSATTLIYRATPKATTSLLNTSNWEHIKISFNYCSASAVNVLYLSLKGMFGTPSAQFIDNVSIKEVPISVTASVKQVGSCLRKLIANEDEIASYGCNPTLYSWYAGGVFIGYGKELTVEPLVPTTYVVIADDGCGNTATDEITVNPCRCSPYYVFGTSSFQVLDKTSIIPTPLPTGTYFVSDDISISANNSFVASNVLINPGVTITVNHNAKLTIDNSHLFVCPDTNKLWDGIVLASDPVTHTSATIEVINNTLIEDAEVAIKAKNPLPVSSVVVGDFIKINSSTFNRNFVSVWIENYDSPLLPVYPFKFTNSVFTSRRLSSFAGYPIFWPSTASLKLPYNCSTAIPSTCIDARPPFIIDRAYDPLNLKDGKLCGGGLHLIDVGLSYTVPPTYFEIVVGDETPENEKSNLFDNMLCGVYASNSNLTAYNNTFINMKQLPAASSDYGLAGWNGIGIASESTNGDRHRLRVLGVSGGGNNVVGNNFYDCKIGVLATNLWSFTVYKNLFQTSNTTPSLGIYGPRGNFQVGIYAISNYYENNQIEGNDMYNVPIGIQLHNQHTMGFNFGQNNIISNKIYQQAPPPFISNPSYYVHQGIVLNANGFWLGRTGTTTGSNYIYNNYLKDVNNGIAVNGQNKTNTDATGNYIDLINNGKAQYAINYANSYKGHVAGNFIYGFGGAATSDKARGIYASMTQDLKICDNFVKDIGRGFEFANTRAQTGTKWTNNTMTNNLKGFVLGSDIGDQSVITSWTPFPISMMYASNNIWTGGSTAWAGKFQTFVEYNSVAAAPDVMNSKLYVRTLGTEEPSNNQSSPPLHEYKNSGTPLSIINGATTLATCYDYSFKPMSLTALSHWLIADTLAYGSGYHPAQWMGQLAQYQAGLADTSLSDSSASFARFMSAASASRFAWLSAIEDALANDDTAAAQGLLASPVAAMGRVAIDSEVVVTDYSAANYIVDNYTDFYSLYLHYLKGTFSSNDTNTLNALTLMCPAKDGAVVHQARAFYDYLLQTHTVYDDDSCIVNGQSTYRLAPTINDAIAQSYSLFPNPNDGSFVLKQSVIINKSISIKVYDALGRMVYAVEQQFKDGKSNLRMPNAFPGLYLVCIGDRMVSNQCIKFTIK